MATSTRAILEPLAEDRFLVKVTLTRTTRDKLEFARDLMRHKNPDGRLDTVLEAALDALLDRLEARKFGRTKQPRDAPRADLPSKAPRANNIRVLCRAHNRLEAERAYGRHHVEAAIAEAQRARSGQRAARGRRGSTRGLRPGVEPEAASVPRHRG